MHSSAQRVAKNTGILYARMAITVFISLYSTRLVLIALGASDFGLFNLVGGAIAMLTFLNNAMADSTVRFMAHAEGEKDLTKKIKIFNISIIIHFFIAIIVVILLEVGFLILFNGVFNIPESRTYAAKYIYQFLVVSTFISILTVPFSAVILARENMFLVAILGIFEAIIKLLIALFLINYQGDKLIFYGLLMTCLSILLLFIKQFYCYKKYEEASINIRTNFDNKILNEMTSFAGWSLLGASSSMFATYGQGIVLNSFFGTIVNAAQAVALQISGQLSALSNTMLKALNPTIFKSSGAGNNNYMLEAALTGSKFSFYLLLLFYVPAFIELPIILKLWLENVPEYAIIFCRLFLLRNLIDQLHISIGTSLMAVGDIKKFQIYTSILNIIPLIVSFILFLFKLPAPTLYIVYLVNSAIMLYFVINFAKKICSLSINDYMKNVFYPSIISLTLGMLISAAPYFLMNESLMRFTITALISFIVNIVVIWNLGINNDERNNILSLLKSSYLKISHKYI